MNQRSPFLAAFAVVAATVLAIGCSTTTDEDDAGKKGTTVDGGGIDAPLPQEISQTKVDPFACPGGHGCACADDAACTWGVCIEGAVAGKSGKGCTTPCGSGCEKGMACAALKKGDETINHCVPAHVNLCDPCTKTDTCTSFGRAGSACVSYGGAGNFCGAACDGDAGCPTGYACEMATLAEGGASLQCVKKPAAGGGAGSYGECSCSDSAKAKGLGTACYSESKGLRCPGSRSCGANGLSACSAKAPAAEACDGADNDCDGQIDEDTCGDGNPCTADACKDGKCVNSNITAPCNADDSVCTTGDACKDGKCAAGKTISCDDGNGCTKDSCDKLTGCKTEPAELSSCDADGDKCTPGDACSGGVCVTGDPKNCDDKKPCTVDRCNASTGSCENKLVVGLACDDGDICTHTDLCANGGKCAGTTRACNDGNACTTDACDAKKGAKDACQHTAGSGACDDGNKCTTGDKCTAGSCAPGTAKVCKASKPCTTVYCNGLTGSCVEEKAKVGAPCDDGKPCTVGDGCDAAGKCQSGKPKICGDGPACQSGVCNTKTGKCEPGQAKDGSACDDGNTCTSGTTCAKGKCTGGKPRDCNDKNACTTDSCVSAKGCQNLKVADGLKCDDGNSCNLSQCASGSCVKTKDLCNCGKNADCDDLDACTTDTCNTSTKKCAFAPGTAGSSCEDGDKCTSGDKCATVSGKLVCQGGAKTDCDDKEACTTDSCDKVKGCQHAALKDATTCDDNSKCTATTSCKSGKCTGPSVACTDNGKACRPNRCDPLTGKCAESDAKDGTKCDDGDKCTESDGCKTGKCQGAPLARTVATLAGSGSGGYKDGTGTGATFNAPMGVAIDSAGTIYVAEGGVANFYRIRKMDAAGKVTTFAGKGLAGWFDGTGTSAMFRAPKGLVAVGTDLYVVDANNQRIRKVDKDAKVTTFAGSGAEPGFGQTKVKGGFKDAKGVAALFSDPVGIAAIGTTLYVADAGNNRIRKIVADGTATTLAGSATAGSKDGTGGAATFSAPTGIAAAGTTIYVADLGGHRIRKVTDKGVVTTFAGSSKGFKDGSGTAAQFNEPYGLSLDLAGSLLVGDSKNSRVRLITAAGAVAVYAGTGDNASADGAALKAKFKSPWGVAADGKGNTYVADPFDHRIRVIKDPFKLCKKP